MQPSACADASIQSCSACPMLHATCKSACIMRSSVSLGCVLALQFARIACQFMSSKGGSKKSGGVQGWEVVERFGAICW